MDITAAYERVKRMMAGHVANGASGADVVKAYRTTERAFRNCTDGREKIAASLAMWIEAQAEPGTVWEAAANELANT